jgi:hypothetical protein
MNLQHLQLQPLSALEQPDNHQRYNGTCPVQQLSNISRFTVFTTHNRGTWFHVSVGINLCTFTRKKYEAETG